ncbi:P-loop containing nucleoside triphosphate hydrolase protein [Clavulina sp. PMI_390]|nr:P-loop containing nucleoside triphosphate hydrolase protein [Clavulina sp. PMI_390]
MFRARRNVAAFLSGFRRYASTTPAITLRPYQEACINSCLEALGAGHSRIGVSSPTGSGKTTMFVSLIERLGPRNGNDDASRSLIIVNSVELVRQTAESVRRLFPQLTVEIEQGSKNNASGFADVTVATYQTLLQPHRLEKFRPEHLKAIIVDEAHHAAAPSYRKILSHFDPVIVADDRSAGPSTPPTSSGIPIVGFSATFSRHDGLALGSVFERIVYHRDFTEMIDEKWLSPVRFTAVKAEIDLSGVTVNSRSGDFNASSLAHVINTDSVNKLVLQTWLDRAAPTRKSTLIFCVNIAHVVQLTNLFRQAGVDARYLHAKTPAHERKTLLDDFRGGKIPVLVNCAILTEGADIPNVDCVLVARPTRSRNIFTQMIGRGMRLSPNTGKVDCHIIDFVDALHRVDGVISAPTLFGLDPTADIQDKSLEELRAESPALADTVPTSSAVKVALSTPTPKSVTYEDYENPWSLANDASGFPNLHKFSSLAWVCARKDVYVLECLAFGYIKIEPFASQQVGDPPFVAYYYSTRSGEKSIRLKRKILTADSIRNAIMGCDKFTSKIMPGPSAIGLLRTAKWRKEPASDNQKLLIKRHLRLGSTDSPGKAKSAMEVMATGAHQQAEKPISFDTLTKGQAANILSRVFHGALRYYGARARTIRKTEDLATRKRLREERQVVRVGPLRA